MLIGCYLKIRLTALKVVFSHITTHGVPIGRRRVPLWRNQSRKKKAYFVLWRWGMRRERREGGSGKGRSIDRCGRERRRTETVRQRERLIF